MDAVSVRIGAGLFSSSRAIKYKLTENTQLMPRIMQDASFWLSHLQRLQVSLQLCAHQLNYIYIHFNRLSSLMEFHRIHTLDQAQTPAEKITR